MRAGRALRQMVISRIEAQVPDLAGKVYDKATATAAYPYASLGSSDWSDDSADCIRSRTYALQIDIWHSGSNKGVVEDLIDDVTDALRDWVGEDVAAHPIEVRLARVLDDPSGDAHGVLQIEIEIEG